MATEKQAFLNPHDSPLRRNAPHLILLSIARALTGEKKANGHPRTTFTPFVYMTACHTQSASGNPVVVMSFPSRNLITTNSGLDTNHEYTARTNTLYLGKAASNMFSEISGINAKDLGDKKKIVLTKLSGCTIIFRDTRGIVTPDQETIITSFALNQQRDLPIVNSDVFPDYMTDESEKNAARVVRSMSTFINLETTMRTLAQHSDGSILIEGIDVPNLAGSAQVAIDPLSLFAIERLIHDTPFFAKGMFQIAPPPEGRAYWVLPEQILPGIKNPYDWSARRPSGGTVNIMDKGLSTKIRTYNKEPG